MSLRVLDTSPGGKNVKTTFVPNRTDDLYISSQCGGDIAYRTLRREGKLTSPFAARIEISEPSVNIIGRSADLLFAIALLVEQYEQRGWKNIALVTAVAATGVLDDSGTVHAVSHVESKVAAAVAEVRTERSIVFIPAANLQEIKISSLAAEYPNIEIVGVTHLHEALEKLGVVLLHTYLRCPFRGLESFDYEHNLIFFGRDNDIRSLLDTLLSREAVGTPGAIIVGASGSGKSSFMRAGILPELTSATIKAPDGVRQELARRPFEGRLEKSIWRPSSIQNGANEAIFVLGISRCFDQWPGLAECLNRKPPSTFTDLLGLIISSWPNNKRCGLLIDQLEELFLLQLSEVLLISFGEFLRQLQKLGVWIIATLRDDFLPALLTIDSLREVFSHEQGLYYLKGLGHAALEETITEPARFAELTYEVSPNGQQLDKTLREEAFGEREPLPLLEFTLLELYRLRDKQVLTFDAYNKIGGIRGAVASRANATLTGLNGEEKEVLLAALSRLIQVQPSRDTGTSDSYTRRVGFDDEFSPEEHRLIEQLVMARLLVRSRASNSSRQTIELAHEAIVTEWKPLQQWLNDHRSQLLWRQDFLFPQIRRWQDSNQLNRYLLPPNLLREARTQLSSSTLTPIEADYLSRSALAIRKRRVATIGLGAVALIMLGVAYGFYWDEQRVKVGYYRGLTTGWGSPIGVASITAGEATHRAAVYRIERRGRKITEVTRINGSGVLTPNKYGEARWVYEYDGEGRVATVRTWSVKELLQEDTYSFEDFSIEELQKTQVAPIEQGPLRVGLYLRRNVSTRLAVVKSRSFAPSRMPDPGSVMWTDETSNTQIVRASDSDLTQVLLFDKRGYVLVSRLIKYEPIDESRPNDVEKKPVVFSEEVDFRDRDGELIQRNRDAQDAIANSVSYAWSNGQIIRKTYWARVLEIGQIPSSQSDADKTEFNYEPDAAGSVHEAPQDGEKPSLWRYDSHGNVLSRGCWNGIRTVPRFSACEMRFSYDRDGHRVSEAYVDESGAPINIDVPLPPEARDRDATGNMITEAQFPTDGERLLHSLGYSKVEYEYAGDLIRQACYTLGRRAIEGPVAAEKLCRRTDSEDDHHLIETFRNDKGGTSLNQDGYAVGEYLYSADGNLAIENFYDKRKRPVLNRFGYARAEYFHGSASASVDRYSIYDQEGALILSVSTFGLAPDEKEIALGNGGAFTLKTEDLAGESPRMVVITDDDHHIVHLPAAKNHKRADQHIGNGTSFRSRVVYVPSIHQALVLGIEIEKNSNSGECHYMVVPVTVRTSNSPPYVVSPSVEWIRGSKYFGNFAIAERNATLGMYMDNPKVLDLQHWYLDDHPIIRSYVWDSAAHKFVLSRRNETEMPSPDEALFGPNMAFQFERDESCAAPNGEYDDRELIVRRGANFPEL